MQKGSDVEDVYVFILQRSLSSASRTVSYLLLYLPLGSEVTLKLAALNSAG